MNLRIEVPSIITFIFPFTEFSAQDASITYYEVISKIVQDLQQHA
jgi:hypothetical protein